MLSAAYRNIRLLLGLGGLFCGIASGQAQAPAVHEAKVSPEPKLPTVTRGQTVMVTGENLPTQGVQVFLRTGREKAGDNGTPVDAVVAADGKSLTFKVPKDPFVTGRYLVYVSYDTPAVPATSQAPAVPAGTKQLAVPGDLTVGPDDAGRRYGLDSIYPATDYGNDEDNAYDFEISGDSLSSSGKG